MVEVGRGEDWAITVWSGVRVVLVFWPRVFTSLRACAYAWLVTAEGAAGRNCAALFSTKGVTLSQLVKTGAANFGGVSWELPAWFPGSKGWNVAVEPSLSPLAIKRGVTAVPSRLPRRFP